jgi:hypothetical protein
MSGDTLPTLDSSSPSNALLQPQTLELVGRGNQWRERYKYCITTLDDCYEYHDCATAIISSFIPYLAGLIHFRNSAFAGTASFTTNLHTCDCIYVIVSGICTGDQGVWRILQGPLGKAAGLLNGGRLAISSRMESTNHRPEQVGWRYHQP